MGFPVHQAVETGGLQFKTWPALEVLALLHAGPPETLKETRRILHQFAVEKALVSDEVIRETTMTGATRRAPSKPNSATP